MSSVARHDFDRDHQNARNKAEVLEWLVPRAIHDEVRSARADGYRISYGDTVDRAYDRPDKIGHVHDNLEEGQEIFDIAMGRFHVGVETVLRTVRLGSPIPSLRKTAKETLAQRREKAESIRADLLYDIVKGGPWHDQNGKALALGTIVDAHDLRTFGSYDGQYDYMSGRLDTDVLTHTFGENSGWLAGLSLEDALVQAQMKFRGFDEEKALSVQQDEMKKLSEFVSTPSTSEFKDIVAYCVDSLGIRSRKDEVHKRINEYAKTNKNTDLLMMSVGCGTALPMLEVMKDLKEQGMNPQLVLLDQDPIALAAAEQFAKQMGVEDAIEIHCAELFEGSGLKTRVMDIQSVLQGRELDVCEDSGLREYFPDRLYKDLTSQAWNALKPGGLMTTGNMNKNRAQPKFLHGLMGWPIPVTMRNIKDITRLHHTAGIPKEAMELRVTQDGTYTLCFSSKPNINRTHISLAK